MAHFAELNEQNIVQRVIVVSDTDAVDGESFCHALLGGRWKQTSYNTRNGQHYDPVTGLPDGKPAFRGNYAGIGDVYDDTLDAFIPASPYPSWQLNVDTYSWEAPVPRPTDGQRYTWDENMRMWSPVT